MDELTSYEDRKLLMQQWDKLYELGENASYFFRARNIKKIAVCGEEQLMERLREDLRASEVKISYSIGTDPITEATGTSVFKIGDKLPIVELIVIAATDNYMEIERCISETNRVEIIAIQELIDKTLRNL